MKTQLYLKSVLIFIVLLMPVVVQAQEKADNSQQLIVYFSAGVTRDLGKQTLSDTLITLTASIQKVLGTYRLNAGSLKPAFPGFKETDTLLVNKGSENTLDPVSVKDMNKSKIYVITCPDIATRDKLMADLRKAPEVLFAEPNGSVKHDLVPNDTRFGEQWALRNVGGGIRAEAAWDIYTGSTANIIAIVDHTGVNASHPDLSGKVVGVAGTSDVHGTGCAGVAAARTGNSIGIAGVDWNAGIYAARSNGTDDQDLNTKIVNAVNYSANVRVLSSSFGLSTVNGLPGRYSIVVRQAYAVAYKANRVLCASMGNDNNNPNVPPNTPNYPAAFNTGMIAVGATNTLNQPTAFSMRGAHIDVAAPGENILTTSGTGYAEMSGTSFSTPMVAGLASLIIGYRPQLANDDVEQIIRLTANDDPVTPGFDNATGTGRVNAQTALQMLQNNTVYQLSATGGTVTNSTGNMQRVFLGVSGLADAAYLVRRHTVEKTVTFPNRMCNMIGAWGRGLGTSGLREEGGYCFGEPICEVVPGTVSNSGMTLRTYVYEVLNVLGQTLGYYPTTPQTVNFAYSVWGIPAATQIIGSDNLCTTAAYTINGLPPGASVNWSVTPTGMVTSSISGNTITLTKVGTTNAAITLTGTYTCNGTPNSIQKTVYVGPVTPHISSTITNQGMTTVNYTATPVVPGATYKWYDSGILDSQGPSNTYSISLDCGVEAYISCKITTTCGTSLPSNEYKVRGRCNKSFIISPNPSSNVLTIAIDQSGDVKQKRSGVNGMIKRINVADANGVIKKHFSNKEGIAQLTIDISDLKAGFYVVSIFDGRQWETHKLIVQH